MWSVGVWSMERKVCSVKYGVWSLSVKCGVWSVYRVEWTVWSVECQVWSVECGV